HGVLPRASDDSQPRSRENRSPSGTIRHRLQNDRAQSHGELRMDQLCRGSFSGIFCFRRLSTLGKPDRHQNRLAAGKVYSQFPDERTEMPGRRRTYQPPELASNKRIVFSMSMMMVIGPAPPGTGVAARTSSSLKRTSPHSRVFPPPASMR